jgi:hypothetical protein
VFFESMAEAAKEGKKALGCASARGRGQAVHGADEGRHILIDVTRYLAAHSPTERAALQTADIPRRLGRRAASGDWPRDALQRPEK